MKFYFCETCGQRITEEEIQEGLGKNKKLRGVYCKECAVGVTTMDSLPLTDDQAADLVQSEKSRAPKRFTPGSGQPNRPGSRSTHSSRSPKARVGPPKSGAGQLVVVIGSVAGLFVLILAVFFAAGPSKKAGRSRKGPKAKASSTSRKPSTSEDKVAARDESNPTSQVEPTVASPDRTVVTTQEPPQDGEKETIEKEEMEAAFQHIVNLEKVEGSREERIEKAKAFLAAYGDSLLASRVRVMLDKWTAPPKPEPTKKPSPPENPQEHTDPNSDVAKPAEPETQKKAEPKSPDAGSAPSKAATPASPAPKPEAETGFKFTKLAPNEAGRAEDLKIGYQTGRRSCAAADLNGDGAPDLVLWGWHEVPKVWLNQGKGIFKPDPVPIATRYVFGGTGPRWWWDFNNDRCMDAVGASGSGAFFSNQPSGAWQKRNSGLPDRGILVDLDGDGHHEELWNREGRGHYLHPKMRAWGALPPPKSPQVVHSWEAESLLGKGHWSEVCSVDLDGDHKNELIVNNLASKLGRVLSRKGRSRDIGAWVDTTSKRGLPTEEGHRFMPLDLEPDGDLDLIDARSSYYFINNGKGAFEKSSTHIDTGRAHLRSKWSTFDGDFNTWDWNNDGRQDCWPGSTLSYLNMGKGTFVHKKDFMWPHHHIVVADIDGDCDLDLVYLGGSSLSIFRNDTPNRGIDLFLVPRAYPSTPLGSKIWVYEPGKLGQNEHLLHYRQVYMATVGAQGKTRIDYRYHIGVGKHETVDVRVRFPSGKVREKREVKTKTTIKIAE